MGFPMTPRSMTLDDLELYKLEFSVNFAEFRRFRTQQQLNEWRQWQRCKQVELEQFLACFRVVRVFSVTAGLSCWLTVSWANTPDQSSWYRISARNKLSSWKC